MGVDTGYVTSDDIAPGVWGGPARVCLTPDGICTVVPLAMGKRPVSALANPARRIL